MKDCKGKIADFVKTQLIPALHGDFLQALWSGRPCFHVALTGQAEDLLRYIPVAYGFESPASTLAPGSSRQVVRDGLGKPD